jgi:hypothetical protein
MKANELRIGNLVFYGTIDLNNGNQIEEIISVCGNDIKLQESKNVFEPIPLTEEWPSKFGFEKSMGSLAYRKGDFAILIWEDKSVTIEFKNIAIAVINFVHEFQNIYFALKHKEITIKE